MNPETSKRWQAEADPRATDDRLRMAGWEIVSRPERGEPTWLHKISGRVMTQSQAVTTLAKLAEYEECGQIERRREQELAMEHSE